MLRRVSLAMTAFLVVLCVPGLAYAGDGIGSVSCEAAPQPGCEVKAGTPGDPSTRGDSPPSGSATNPPNDSGSTTGASTENAAESPISSVECAPLGAAIGGAVGSGREAQCVPPAENSDTAPAAVTAQPSPGELGRQASSRLVLPTLVVSTSPGPGVPQLVRVPTWLWVNADSFGQQSATASVPGMTVTATAAPVSVVWSMGDGSRVECSGAGTPWRAGMNPAAASPDCGHTYVRASTSEPGGVFVVSATVTWRVSWAGGGQTDELDPLETTATTQLRVAESQAVNTST